VEVHVEEHVVRRLFSLAHVRTDAHVVDDGHAAEELDVLERPRDSSADHAARGRAEEALAVEADIAFGRRVQTGDHVERGRLPGTVRANQPYDLAGARVERDRVERDDASELHGDLLDFEERHGPPTLKCGNDAPNR